MSRPWLVFLVSIGGLFCCPVAGADTGPANYHLADAVDQALRGNPDYLNLLGDVELAELDLDKARAVFRTKLSTTINSDARTGAQVGSTFGLGLTKRQPSGSRWRIGLNNSSFGVNNLSEVRLSYVLPLFKKAASNGKFDVYRAELDYKHRQWFSQLSAEDLIYTVIQAYYQLALAINRIDVTRSELANANKLLQITRIRVSAGRSSTLDLKRASLRLAQARQRRQVTRLERRKAENRLKLLLGLEADAALSIDRKIPMVKSADLATANIQGAESSARERRIELISMAEDLKLARRKLRAQSGSNLPEIDIELQYSLVGEGNSFENSLHLNDQRIGVGVSMNVGMLGTSTNDNTRRLALAYTKQARLYQKLENEISMEVQDAVFSLQQSVSQLGLARESLALAQQQYQVTTLRYDKGIANTVDALQAQQELADARHDELSARVNYLFAAYQLQKANGELLRKWQLLHTFGVP